jgi:basic membrane protein A and related proteins
VKHTSRAALVVAALSLTLSACGERDSGGSASDEPTASETSSSAPSEQYPDFKACIVSDSGGFEDKSFNETSYAGLMAAKESLGVKTAEVESNAVAEFEDNIQAMVQQDCNSITTVGFLLGDATEKAAKAHPKIDFSIVDFAYEAPPKNLKGLLFNTAEPSFLAGYLAAGVSESGVVGTFGGQNIPSVTAFMEGFRQGVERYNDDEGAEVRVVGWDGQKGSFTNDFEAKNKGQDTAEKMIQQGADVIFPVAGPAGLGGLQAAKDQQVRAIWVDSDGCESAAEYCDVLLTSVMKGMDVAVQEAVTASAEDSFSNDVYTGTLENDGVGLAPYHEQEDSIPGELKDKIEELKQQIIEAELTVDVG